MASAPARLRLIKLVHTITWAFFASCIVAIPALAWTGHFGPALLFIGIVAIEVLVVAVNAWHCPLTPVAARYTTDRRPNFDIYLPEWRPGTTRRSSALSMQRA